MTQGSLFPSGNAAKDCSLEALKASKPKRETRKAAILRLLELAGYTGHTRFELARLIGCESSALCAAVGQLIESGAIVELAELRTNSTGSDASLLVLPCWAEGRPLS